MGEQIRRGKGEGVGRAGERGREERMEKRRGRQGIGWREETNKVKP